jgi:hypothetical protein
MCLLVGVLIICFQAVIGRQSSVAFGQVVSNFELRFVEEIYLVLATRCSKTL